MSETKQAWKDVETILRQAGWPTRDEREATSVESGGEVVSPALPSRKEASVYRWLTIVPILAVVSFVLLFAWTTPKMMSVDGAKIEQLSEQLGQANQRIDVLEKEQAQREKVLREAEKSLVEAVHKLEGARESTARIQNSVNELREDQRKTKADLADTLKALRALKHDLGAQFSAIDERLTEERKQRIKSIEDVKKRFPGKPVELENGLPSKQPSR